MLLKRLLLYLLVECILLGAAFSADQWYKDTQLLQDYASSLSAYLARQESDAAAWTNAHRPALQGLLTGAMAAPDPDASIAGRDFTLLLLRGDSVVFWSNNKIIPSQREREVLVKSTGRRVVELATGFYAVVNEHLGEGTLLTLTPIRYTHEADWGNRGRLFPTSKMIPHTVQVSLQTTPYAIKTGGENLAWLDGRQVQPEWVQWVKLCFYLLALGVLLGMAQLMAAAAASRFGAPAGVGLAGLTTVAIIAGLSWSGFTVNSLGNLSLFSEVWGAAAWMGRSLGDWLIGVAVMVWFALFFHRSVRGAELTKQSAAVRWSGAMAGYGLVGGGLALAMASARELVLHSGIYFDFDNILNISKNGALAIGGLILLLSALFLLSHRVVRSLLQANFSRGERWAAMSGAAAVAFLLAFPLGLGWAEAMGIALVAFAYLVGLDSALAWKMPGFGLVVSWLLVFALFMGLMLYRYNDVKDEQLRLAYAETLVAQQDSMAEPAVLRILEANKRSTQLDSLLKPFPFKPKAEAVRAFFAEKIFRENYLFQHYRLNVFAFDAEGQPLIIGQGGDREYVGMNWQEGKPLPGSGNPQGDQSGIRFRADDEGNFRYMIRLQAYRMGDQSQPAGVYVFLDRNYPKATRVYSSLFFNRPYQDLERLRNYDYAVLFGDRLVVEQGQANLNAARTMLHNGQARDLRSQHPNRVDAVYRSEDGHTAATVGRAGGGWYKPLYLFSMLFVVMSVLLFAAALANAWLKFLPARYGFSLSAKGSLARRIHYGYVTLIIALFFVLGWLTWRHFSTSAEDSEQARLDFRSNALLTNLRTELGDLAPETDTLRNALPRTLAPLAASLAMDANLYDPSGSLVFTTEKDLGALGVLPQKMNALAFAALRTGGATDAAVMEQTADFRYLVKYLPVRNTRNQLLAFLSVPYQNTERRTGPEVSDFIGALATLYVFLLLIAYVGTFFLARSIVRPVNLISEKIRELQLANRNETLDYAGGSEDELSALINEYNKMVGKIEESKIRMIRLEREGAWREMARQVAHDIKNPLTTMKLSMQQLERVSSDPAQAAAYLKKAITRLIEQIDSLAQIASEFSMFANLEIRERHDMVLNEVVESVYDLFSEQRDLDHTLRLPEERMHILGDKNYFIRVLNNLVINAMQAIPSDRRGNIEVSLYRRGNNAVVQISDNGGGIPPEIRDRVFEPNFTTKTSGSGLGLAICRKIVEALDGSIRFETRDNEGTDFFVELPITGVEHGEKLVSREEA